MSMSGLSEKELADALRRATPEPGTNVGRAGQVRARAGRLRSRRRATAAGAVVCTVAAVVLAVGLPSWLASPGRQPRAVAPAASASPSGHWVACSPGVDGTFPCGPGAVAAAIRKPLNLPTLAPGASCPVSPTRTFPHGGAGFSGSFQALGPGPFYMAGPGSTPLQLRPDRSSGWDEQKVIWVVDKTYGGPLLLRGGRIDAPGRLGFAHYIGAAHYSGGAGDGKAHRSLLYERAGFGADDRGTLDSFPSGVYIPPSGLPGCYAIQVDGVGFSETLVFRATGSPSAG
ncbi:MAG TPA: hypothetical protein VFJ19_03975 [Nocardioidaceae bacterium]|nr:hypothetical protein [Nocardioidaceae bacterium]